MHIISVEEMRRLEKAAMESGVSGSQLMGKAGENAAEEIMRIADGLPKRHRRRFVVLAGKGNNGGDAWVVARTLFKAGRDVLLVSVCSSDMLGEDARWHAEQLPTDCPWEVCDSAIPPGAFHEGDIIVDGLLGTGGHGAPRSIYKELIDGVNALSYPVIALDVPSGLDADTGEGTNACRADWTLTMGFPKKGLFVGDGFKLSGTVRVIDIGLPEDVKTTAQAVGHAFGREDACRLLQQRRPDSHKYSFGHLACFCNSTDYAGAGYLCATSALRTGAGLVTLATPAGSFRREGPAALIQRSLGRPEEGAFSADMSCALDGVLKGKTAIVYGPGTGQSADMMFLDALLERRLPIVIDADGLRLLAKNPRNLNDRAVLTPHPGEMQCLLNGYGLSHLTDADPTKQAQELANTARCVVALKGRFTCVAAAFSPEDGPSLNLSGDVALATAGSGDVLAGVIGALLAEGMTPIQAAKLGVYVHGLAGEMRHSAARSLIADDLPILLGEAFLSLGAMN